MTSIGDEQLYHAVINGHLDSVHRMIKVGTDVNMRIGCIESTALHFAANGGDVPMVRLLLKHGADVAMQDIAGLSPLHVSFHCGPENMDVYKVLLENGADCNEKCPSDGISPFHLALRGRSLRTVKMLLENGADIEALSNRGETALHFSVKNVDQDVLKFILDLGVPIESSDVHGFSVLHYAAALGRPESCRFLLERGAVVNRRCSRTDDTALSLAIQAHVRQLEYSTKFTKTVQVLLEHGADVADKCRGTSVLEMAANQQRGFEELPPDAAVLVRHMARIERCLHWSMAKEDRQVIENNEHCQDYYKKCLQELETMEKTKFYNNVSIFNLLKGNGNVISAYARNDQLVKAFDNQEGCSERFPVYFVSLKKRFYAEVQKQRKRNAAAKVLGNILTLNDPIHPVIQMILDYLRDDDLKFLEI